MNTVLILKLLSMVSLFRNVTKEVQEMGESKRPWYMQRSAWGAIIAAVSTLSATVLGVSLDTTTLTTLTDNIPQLITVAMTLYGSVLSMYGMLMKLRK